MREAAATIGRGASRWWAAPLAIVALALAVRLVAIAADGGYEPRNDAWDYQRHAVSIASGDGYPDSEYGSGAGPTALRPPAYPALLGGVYAVIGDDPDVGRVVGALLGAVSAGLIFLIAAPLWGRWVALLAAAIFAVLPSLVRLSTELFSENLFVALMLAALLCAVRYRDTARMRWAAATGLACGLALLTRNVGLALVVPLALAVGLGARGRGGSPAAAGVLVLCAALTLVPWTLRNAAEFDRLIPIAASSGVTLAGIYNEQARTDEAHPAGWRNPAGVAEFEDVFATPGIDEATLDARLRSDALEFAGDHPGYVLEASWRNLGRILLVDGGSVVAGGSEVTVSGIGNTSTVAEQIGIALAAVLALIGILAAAFARRLSARTSIPVRRIPWFVWLLPALLLLASLPLGGLPRYRLPIDPFVAMFAALGVVAMREQLPALLARRRTRTAAIVAALAALLALGGCGGGDDETTPVAGPGDQRPAAIDPGDRRRYTAAAEAVCEQALAETRALRRRIQSEGLPADLGTAQALAVGLVEPGLAIRERQARALRELPRPEGDDPDLDVYLGLFDAIGELLRERLRLGLDGELAAAQDLEQLILELGSEQRAAARRFGFDACATNFFSVLIPPSPDG